MVQQASEVKVAPPTEDDRLAVRERPAGQPIMHQNWGKLLFLHWRVDETCIRQLIPEPLTIDTFDGSAWIAITPFTMWDIRAVPPFIPAIPGFSSLHELNVRTYVYLENVPGVWFFSLDANSYAAVFTARALYHLPYFNAEIKLEQEDQRINYSLRRTDKPPAQFSASWNIGEPIPFSQPGSLEFFLTERYCLYSQTRGKLYRARIFHQPWSLRKARLRTFNSTMIESHGLPTPVTDPLLHYAEEIAVDIWSLKSVANSL